MILQNNSKVRLLTAPMEIVWGKSSKTVTIEYDIKE